MAYTDDIFFIFLNMKSIHFLQKNEFGNILLVLNVTPIIYTLNNGRNKCSEIT